MDPVQIVMAAIFAIKEIQQLRTAGHEMTEEQEKVIAQKHLLRVQGINATIEGEMKEGES
jgi:hypothetical protein